MKANFKIRKDTDSTDIKKSSILEEDKKNLMTEEEFVKKGINVWTYRTKSI